MILLYLLDFLIVFLGNTGEFVFQNFEFPVKFLIPRFMFIILLVSLDLNIIDCYLLLLDELGLHGVKSHRMLSLHGLDSLN